MLTGDDTGRGKENPPETGSADHAVATPPGAAPDAFAARGGGSVPKRHHVVPRFYLERFAVDNYVELVARDDFGRSFPVSIDRALAENYFYSIETDEGRDPFAEDFLAEHVDGPAAEAIRRMFDRGRSLNAPGPRRTISLFLAFQAIRGARQRYALVEHHKAVVRKLSSMATPELVMKYARAAGDDDVTEDEAADTAQFARSGEFTIKIDREANLHLGAVLPAALELAPRIYERIWCVFEFAQPCLLTSDEPVALVGADPDAPGSAGGFATARQIAFPLDPQRALVMFTPDHDIEQTRMLRGARQAQVINQHVVFTAHRFIVRRPGMDLPTGLVVPERAPAIFEVGDLVGLSPNQSAAARAKVVARAKAWNKKKVRP